MIRVALSLSIVCMMMACDEGEPDSVPADALLVDDVSDSGPPPICTPEEMQQQDGRQFCRPAVPESEVITLVVTNVAADEVVVNVSFYVVQGDEESSSRRLYVRGRVDNKRISGQGADTFFLMRLDEEGNPSSVWISQDEPDHDLRWDQLWCYPRAVFGREGFFVEVLCDLGGGVNHTVISALLSHASCSNGQAWMDRLQAVRPMPMGYESHVVADDDPSGRRGALIDPARGPADNQGALFVEYLPFAEAGECIAHEGAITHTLMYDQRGNPYTVDVFYDIDRAVPF